MAMDFVDLSYFFFLKQYIYILLNTKNNTVKQLFDVQMNKAIFFKSVRQSPAGMMAVLEYMHTGAAFITIISDIWMQISKIPAISPFNNAYRKQKKIYGSELCDTENVGGTH